MTPRHYETMSDEHLQERALSFANEREAVLSEVLFRTRDATFAEMRAANKLTEKIESLNWWLLGYTVAMALMAAFQLGILVWENAHR